MGKKKGKKKKKHVKPPKKGKSKEFDKKNEKKTKLVDRKVNLDKLPVPTSKKITVEKYRGPNDCKTLFSSNPKDSNWVLPGKLMCGGYPFQRSLRDVCVTARINCFFNLVTDREVRKIFDYQHSKSFKILCEEGNPGVEIEYFHYPIVDTEIPEEDETTIEIVDKVISKVSTGRTVYVHCLGGHGRTGLIIALFLSKVFGFDAFEALEITQLMHDTRKKTKGLRSPESSMQRSSVHKLAQLVMGKKRKKEEE